MKTSFLALVALLSMSCGNGAKDVTDSSPASLTIATALSDAIANTPYSALVKQMKVERIAVPDEHPNDDYAEDKLIYYANVLQTFRGPEAADIRYTMLVERGESYTISDKPVILTLCGSAQELYWPGTGSQFPGGRSFVSVAEASAKSADQAQTDFDYCE